MPQTAVKGWNISQCTGRETTDNLRRQGNCYTVEKVWILGDPLRCLLVFGTHWSQGTGRKSTHPVSDPKRLGHLIQQPPGWGWGKPAGHSREERGRVATVSAEPTAVRRTVLVTLWNLFFEAGVSLDFEEQWQWNWWGASVGLSSAKSLHTRQDTSGTGCEQWHEGLDWIPADGSLLQRGTEPISRPCRDSSSKAVYWLFLRPCLTLHSSSPDC